MVEKYPIRRRESPNKVMRRELVIEMSSPPKRMVMIRIMANCSKGLKSIRIFKENAWFGSNHMQMVSQAKEGLSLIEYERSKSLILYNLQNTLSWFLPGHRLEKAAGLHTLFISNCVFSLCTYHQRQLKEKNAQSVTIHPVKHQEPNPKHKNP